MVLLESIVAASVLTSTSGASTGGGTLLWVVMASGIISSTITIGLKELVDYIRSSRQAAQIAVDSRIRERLYSNTSNVPVTHVVPNEGFSLAIDKILSINEGGVFVFGALGLERPRTWWKASRKSCRRRVATSVTFDNLSA